MPDSTINHYDLIVLGGGPAGIIGSSSAARLGKAVALVDNHHELGGAGINTGTVPSKTLRETALTLTAVRARKIYGLDMSLRREATVGDFLGHERNIKAAFNVSLAERLHANHADVFHGTAGFRDANTISVRMIKPQGEAEEVILHGDRFLIATGSSPVRPPIYPFDHPSVYDSDTILDLKSLPKSMAVIGAGVVGSEYACTFAALGTRVDLIDGRDALLPFLDREISQTLMATMTKNGVNFRWKETVAKCVPGPDGVTLTFVSGQSITVDEVLVASGRKSNVESLNLPAAGVTVGEKGLIKVDEQLRTSVPTIYAAGDVIGFPALASTSMEQARRAVRHAFGLATTSDRPILLPNGIYTIPEASMVGDTEETLKQKGIDYIAGKARYDENPRGKILGEADGFLKLLFRRSDLKLLGVHVIGEQATEVVHIGLMAMMTGATAHLFDEACFNFPTLGGLYKFAAYRAMRELAEKST